ncbi:hypothetical protein N781_17285 [Pontibacillus halophilus JSM 076056 = DSM 19796]|uniref:Putative endonuclease Z1 domain-containing protein n=1 Tax=Pontibacillus halophilus JSM 076056 = DSM 19796 TaxID=1385510 RepID=A0A0A5GKG7_9BACI|nr:Z1 domain-containing protein [Pontibacillus halophilus]KGX92469.1 hypothetical protein N781_17285 [Pontibacillus halophilus JSM 076056 = DSM 19796]
MNRKGYFYKTMAEQNQYDLPTKHALKDVIHNLLREETNMRRPGMLLGKIQSGKTRTFIGALALAFDNGYDIGVVFTKGTKALARQTTQRLEEEYRTFIERDELQVFDIMNVPENLVPYELKQKLVFVVKKEKHNIERLNKVLFERYPSLAEKRALLIDDEADFASVGFEKTERETYDLRTISGALDDLRSRLSRSSFLQVTATPYSLYLQPENYHFKESEKMFKPVRPGFTTLVPVPDEYVGGEFYFEESEQEGSLASFVYESIDPEELLIMKKEDRRRFKLEQALTSQKISSMRRAILQFIVGGLMRRIQERTEGRSLPKYSFIIHTEMKKSTHEWQEQIARSVVEQLTMGLEESPQLVREEIQLAYESLRQSLRAEHCSDDIPSFQSVLYEVSYALQDGQILVAKVNSEGQIEELLNEKGELKLRTPLTIFIGGQLLDRGITISNLIGFYYGRNPRKVQQDTVLQHSRMYGFRARKDLAVTRFYTTREIYETMKRIHEFDRSLQDAFESGGHDGGVVFLQADTNGKIVPCSPNKIMLSKTTTLKPWKRMLPLGFQTGYKTHIQKSVKAIDRLLQGREKEPFLLDIELAKKIIQYIGETLTFNEGYEWDKEAFLSTMQYLSSQSEEHKGKVWIIPRMNRDIARFDEQGRFISAPDTPTGEVGQARTLAVDTPALILLRENGRKEKGWMDAAFYWPVLITPSTTPSTIYTSGMDTGKG